MTKSIILAADASRFSGLASSRSSYLPAVCAFVAPSLNLEPILEQSSD